VQQSGAENARQNARQLKRQQTDKRNEESFYVDNDYYSLNPWVCRLDAYGMGSILTQNTV
jgi:hypothetical protein